PRGARRCCSCRTSRTWPSRRPTRRWSWRARRSTRSSRRCCDDGRDRGGRARAPARRGGGAGGRRGRGPRGSRRPPPRGRAGLAAGGSVALVVALAFASDARDALGLTFPGLPRTLHSVAEVFGANVRLLGVTVIAAAVASMLCGEGRVGRIPVVLCDLALGL